MERRALLGCFTAGLGAVTLGCGPTEVPDRRRELMRSWGEKFLVARYRLFERRLVLLRDAVLELRDEPSEATLGEAQDAWWSAREPWKECEVFALGPYMDVPERYGSDIDFWPARPDSVAELLAADEEIDLMIVGAAFRGLPAAEILLYQEGALTSFEADPRRSEYLLAVVDDLIVHAELIGDAWDPEHADYLSEFTDAGRGSDAYDTLPMALGALVNRMGFTIENIRRDKLGRPIGADGDGTPQPETMESLPSGRSVTDMLDNLRGIEILYFSDEEDGILGLDEYLVQRGYHFSAQMAAELRRSRDALEAIDHPLSTTIVEEREDVELCIDVLGDLQRLIQVDLIAALSLRVRFNDNDGD